jgi:type VI protein secretion system component VasK
MIAATFGVGQLVYAFLWFFLFLVEIYLAILVFADIFRSRDLKGWQKALYVILILVVPLIGILTYLIIRGDKMEQHALEAAEEVDRHFRQYVAMVARQSGPTEDLATLVKLKDRGVIDEEEFTRLKQAIIDEGAPAAA